MKLNTEKLLIENNGPAYTGNTERLLQRFSKGKNGNTGIGLVIVKEIFELYSFKFNYTISEKTHRILIFFQDKLKSPNSLQNRIVVSLLKLKTNKSRGL